LKLASAASALLVPMGAADTRRVFEVSASLYAWDLHDEGIEKILDNLQEMSTVNSVYLVGLMHPEKRPLTSAVFPHNPVRQTWTAEDARVYWHPDPKRYGRIKPRLSDHDWLNKTDWVKLLVEAARKRGLRTGVELSHALVDRERAEGELADCAQRSIRGEITKVRPWLRPICPNHPDTRAYALGLFSDLVANYDLGYVQSCIVSFDEGGPDRGGCFCNSCHRAAQERGLDLEKMRTALASNPKAQPELDQWQAFRYDSVARFYKAMYEGVHAIKPRIDLRYNLHMRNPSDWGIKLAVMKPHLDSVRIMDYSEQQGTAAAMNGKRQWLTENRQQLGKDFPLLSAIAVRPKATPELIRQGVQIAVECGMEGITLGHYDGAEFPMLRAIREGLATTTTKR
jgi:hypothetical protein